MMGPFKGSGVNFCVEGQDVPTTCLTQQIILEPQLVHF